MDTQFKWLKIRDTEGWVWINVENISSVKKFAANALYLRMNSGQLYIVSGKEIKRTLDKLGLT